MKLKGKVVRMTAVEEREGRLGTYQKQGMMLDLTEEGGTRQSVYGSMFGLHIETARALGLQFGDRVEVDTVFTTSERNGFVSNYVEFVNPRKL